MKPHRVSPEEIASFRESVYQLFSCCLLHAPSPELHSLFENPEWRESACALLGYEAKSLYRGFAREGYLDRLAIEHAALFVVPGAQQTFPFETSYREQWMVNGERRPGPIQGYAAVQVQKAYLEWGMPVDLDTAELPDHAGVELRFMALLAAAERLSADSVGMHCAAAIQRAQADFLRRHIMQWFPQWLECVYRRARRPFYKSVATVLRGFLETEMTTLDQVTMQTSPRGN